MTFYLFILTLRLTAPYSGENWVKFVHYSLRRSVGLIGD